ncbi:hypothetical protein [Caenispirillum bisanense]|uniref:hypothetical protein n=1 Tax=Caenispirillum bisanense TaxID=414052 RepID=UPI0031DA2835
MHRRRPFVRRRVAAAAAALAGALLVAGCAVGQLGGPATLSRTDVRDALTISAWQHAVGKGPMLLEVHGSPTAMAPGDFAHALAAVMPSSPFHQPARWTADRARAGERDSRLVLMFGAPVGARGATPCATPESVPVAWGMPDGLAVQMSFCNGAESMGETRLTGPAVSGPDDPRLISMLRQAMARLVPVRAREFDDDHLPGRRCIPPLC